MNEEVKSNAAEWTYQVIINPNFVNGDFGHAILQIESPAGNKLAAGYYPSYSSDSVNFPDFTGIHHVVEGPGFVAYENDEAKYAEYVASKPRKISEDTAQKMKDYIAERVEHPGRYDLLVHNCVEFVEGGMVVAGDRMSMQQALVPFMLKAQIDVQVAIEDALEKTKGVVKEAVSGEVNQKDWDVVTQKYLEMKTLIIGTAAEPAATAAGVDKLTENFANHIDKDDGLHQLAEKIKAAQSQAEHASADARIADRAIEDSSR